MVEETEGVELTDVHAGGRLGGSDRDSGELVKVMEVMELNEVMDMVVEVSEVMDMVEQIVEKVGGVCLNMSTSE